MLYRVDWSASAIEDVRELFEYLAENASLWDAEHVTERVLSSTDRLAEFPRLYEVDDQALGVNVLAVVGQRQKHHQVRS